MSRGIKENKSGVIRTLSESERSYYTSEEVRNLLGVGRTKAYYMMKNCREELISQGRIASDYPEGKIPKKYFNQRYAIN